MDQTCLGRSGRFRAGRSAAETGLHDDLGAAIEEEFGFVFDDNDLITAATLARMLDAIDRQPAWEEA